IIFHAKQRTFPSIRTSEAHTCFFRISADLKNIEQLAGSTDLPDDAVDLFEPNQDGTKIAVPGSNGEIAVLDISTGTVTTLEKTGKQDLKFAPQWRTKDELCYPMRNQQRSSAGHDVDVVLQSMSQPDQRIIISKDWPTSSLEFLKDPEDSKPTQHKSQSK